MYESTWFIFIVERQLLVYTYKQVVVKFILPSSKLEGTSSIIHNVHSSNIGVLASRLYGATTPEL